MNLSVDAFCGFFQLQADADQPVPEVRGNQRPHQVSHCQAPLRQTLVGVPGQTGKFTTPL